MSYETFLASKRIASEPSGFTCDPAWINPALFPFQRDIVRWACRRGKAAIFADTGMGKTAMQLEWARLVRDTTGGDVLILAPLAVAEQTRAEGVKFGVEVTVCRTAADCRPGINIANYERLHHFSPGEFAGLVLDESSILKAYDGKTKAAILDFGEHVPYRLACTATPAPNDLTELCNHAEFLGVMQQKEVKALFFTQDGNSTSQWRLKGHAKRPFYRWLASWAVALRKPSDLGYEDGAFLLPPLDVRQVVVAAGERIGQQSLLSDNPESLTLDERRAARRNSLPDRVAAAAALVNSSSEPWLVWCDLNSESEALVAAIPGAVEVTGTDSNEAKESRMLAFSAGTVRVLVSKPSICGMGMNWQHCANVVFVGLSDSFEQFYQAVRRCWRFGQKRPVTAHVITSTAEGVVVENINRKEQQAREMMDNIVREMAGEVSLSESAVRQEMPYAEAVASGDAWTMYLGDCVKQLRHVADASVGLTVFSPPFPGMYTYTNSPHDIGNTTSLEEMIAHYRFLVPELLRVTKPGRHCCVHLTQYAAHKTTDGFIGMRDFRGAVIATMERAGWRYYGEVCIDKNPQVKAIRTKDRGLLFKTLATDSSHMHMAMADYLLQFRKDGDSGEPIRAGISEKYDNADGWISQEEWIRWARPVWYAEDWAPNGDGIAETDVLNVRQARETDDERHLCPLQLGVIERAIKLWSNPGDLVLSPFAGIGSEGYEAVRLRRRFVGVELKESYWRSACDNLRTAEAIDRGQTSLFDMAVGEAAP